MAAAGLTVADPSLLTGVAVSNGNMLGTAVVVLVVGVPVLAAAIIGAARGSARAAVIWLGTLGYLLYQAVLFCFATPLNNLFLLYVAYLGLGVWTIVAMVRGVDLAAFHQRLSAEVPIRRIAGYALVVAGLNALAWLTRILPATFSDHPRAMLTDSGLLTNPVYIQDLAIWLPVLATAAVAAWRHRTWGELTTGAMLALFVLESISIAVDQWFGSHADPTSSVSSLVMVPIFAVVAVATAVPVVLFLRNIDRAA
ncbi:hypothetical protein [Amnibacterium sp.]|uniref:hypothetical protein n=1 Tax=Amnibacterium sp. TaxID=1872496 RepID=UPI00260AF112|nr:hypothetical protein [Amnibacterium sp.]